MTPMVLLNVAPPMPGMPAMPRAGGAADGLFAAMLNTLRGDGAPAAPDGEILSSAESDPGGSEVAPATIEPALAVPVLPPLPAAIARKAGGEGQSTEAAADHPPLPAATPDLGVTALRGAPAIPADAAGDRAVPWGAVEGRQPRLDTAAPAPREETEAAAPTSPLAPAAPPPVAARSGPTREAPVSAVAAPMDPRSGPHAVEKSRLEVPEPAAVTGPAPSVVHTPTPSAHAPVRAPGPVPRDTSLSPREAELAAAVSVRPTPRAGMAGVSQQALAGPAPAPVQSRAMAAMQRIAATLPEDPAPARGEMVPDDPVAMDPSSDPDRKDLTRLAPAGSSPSPAAPNARAPDGLPAAAVPAPGVPVTVIVEGDPDAVPAQTGPVAERPQASHGEPKATAVQRQADVAGGPAAEIAPMPRAADPAIVDRPAESAPVLPGAEPHRGAPAQAAPVPQGSIPAPVPTQAVGSLIVATAAEGADAQLEITLAPEELGKLSIALRHEGERVVVIVTAERPETLELMRRNADHLAQELRQAGIGGAALSFGQSGQGDQRPPPAAAQGDLPGPDPRAATAGPLPPPPPARHATGAGLDLRL